MLLALCATALAAVSACGSEPEGPDINAEKEIVRETCHEEVSQKLRDPESAQFGKEEHVLAIENIDSDFAYSDPPPSVRTYYLVGSLNGRNGFGGMGEPFAYTCVASFDESDSLITERTNIYTYDDMDGFDEALKFGQEKSIENEGSGTP
ncbi:hypothetical protein [Rhodococcus aetherivorans]|uniref:hypothetical protein n=1 Tax=Rhodococcus aetherivorans TaxID=191292 RepID=UPI00365899AE